MEEAFISKAEKRYRNFGAIWEEVCAPENETTYWENMKRYSLEDKISVFKLKTPRVKENGVKIPWTWKIYAECDGITPQDIPRYLENRRVYACVNINENFDASRVDLIKYVGETSWGTKVDATGFKIFQPLDSLERNVIFMIASQKHCEIPLADEHIAPHGNLYARLSYSLLENKTIIEAAFKPPNVSKFISSSLPNFASLLQKYAVSGEMIAKYLKKYLDRIEKCAHENI